MTVLAFRSAYGLDVAPAVVGVRSSFAATAGSGLLATVSFTLPSGIEDGDVGAFQVSNNAGASTVTAEPAGWTLLDGPVVNGASNLVNWLYTRTLTAADSGTTVSLTLSNSGRWTVGGVVLQNAAAPDATANWADNTDDLALTVASVTPTVDDTLLVALAGARYATTTTGVTAAAGWTELQDTATTNTTAPLFGTWVGTRFNPGGAGTPTGTADQTFAGNARGNGFILAIPTGVPAATVTPDLATAPTQTFAPTVAATVAVTPDLAGAAPSVSAPAVSSAVSVVPGVATSSPTAFNPTVTAAPVTVAPGAASSAAAGLSPTVSSTVTVSPGAAGGAPVVYSPAAQIGAVAVTPGVASSTAAVLAPTASSTVQLAPDLAVSTPAVSAPSVSGAVTVGPGAAGSTATALAPAVAAGGVSLGPAVVGSPAAANPPTVVFGPVTVSPDPAGDQPTVYGPVASVAGGPVTAVPSPAGAPATPHGPSVTGVVVLGPGTAASALEVFAPGVASAVELAPELAQLTAQVFAPTVVLPGMVVGPDPAGEPPAVHDPTVEVGEPAGPARNISFSVAPGRSRVFAATVSARALTAAGSGSSIQTDGGSSREMSAAGASSGFAATPME